MSEAEDETRRTFPTRRELRAEREDRTRVVGRRPSAGTDAEDTDRTVVVERGTDPDESTARRPGPGIRPAEPGIVHGRADTPRHAAAPGTLVSHAVYEPRRGGSAAPVARTPVAPPAAPPSRPSGRRRSTGAAALALAGTAIVAAAIWGIIVIVQGGPG